MTPVRRVLGIPLVLLVAIVVQVAAVNRMPLPGGAAPDLVLLTVTALGAMLGPMTGLVAGFSGGLLLDIAPPAGHLAGEYALVFCLAGYACGRMRDLVDPMEQHPTVISVTVMAVGAAGGEAAKAALGLMMSDPDMAGPAVRHVLPGAILYDLVLTPFVLTLTAMAVSRPARPSTVPHQVRPRTAAQYGAVRTAGAGSAPKLRLSGGPTALTPRSTVRREPRLRLAGSVSPALSRTDRGFSSRPGALGGRRAVSINFSSSGWSGLVSGGMLGPSLFAPSPVRGLAGSGPGKGWLKGSSARPVGPVKRSPVSSPGRGWLRASSKPVAKAPRAGGGPGKGWLRPSKPVKAPRRRSPSRGWLKGSGTLGKRTTYTSRATPSFRRRRGIRLGGRR